MIEKQHLAFGALVGVITLILGVIIGTLYQSTREVEVLSAYIRSYDISPTPTPTNTPTPTPTPTLTPTPTMTPTPLPLPTTIPYTSENLENWFTQYAGQYGADRELLKKIAACESGFNTTSYNTAHGYAGMYQFSAGTWIVTRNAMGEDANLDLRFNPEQAIKTAAYKISKGGAGAWPGCSR